MTINWFEVTYTVIGGLGVFLYGMKGLGESLEAIASDYIRNVIGWLTNNRLLAVLVGFVVTGIIQSSSVTTVMVIGFVNAGLMTLAQSIGVVLGANVGTTVTGWILALKIGKYGLVFLGIGIVPFFFMKGTVPRNIGKILIALGLIFLGLNFMSGGFAPLTKDPGFADSLTFFAADNAVSVIACMCIGCILTVVVQSSSAMLGVTIALATTASEGHPPVIGLQTAIALVLGQNVGTTITAQLAAIGGNVAAKRTAMSHTLFNVIGAAVMIPLFRPYITFIEHFIGPAFDSLSFLYKTEAAQAEYALVGFEIAAAHTTFNVLNVLLFLPFVGQLASVVTWMLPDRDVGARRRLQLLGPISQISPELALEEAAGQVRQLAQFTEAMLVDAQSYLAGTSDDAALRKKINEAEDEGDERQKEVTVFLTTLLQVQVTPKQSNRAYTLIRLADEIESVGDYAKALTNYRYRMFRERESLTEGANRDMQAFLHEVSDFFGETAQAVQDSSPSRLRELLERAEALRARANGIRTVHLQRICEGECAPGVSMTFSDIVVAIRRIKNHAVNMIEAVVGYEVELGEELAQLDVASGDGARSLKASLPPPAP